VIAIYYLAHLNLFTKLSVIVVVAVIAAITVVAVFAEVAFVAVFAVVAVVASDAVVAVVTIPTRDIRFVLHTPIRVLFRKLWTNAVYSLVVTL
jgi:hypothetical protein